MYKKPEDKYGGVKCKNKYPTHLTLKAGSKVKYINLAITWSIFNIITETLYADRLKNNGHEICQT